MYSLNQIRQAIDEPSLVLSEGYEMLRRVHQAYWRRTGHVGFDVMSQGWDNLIVLDACRYDCFKELHSLPGTLSAVRSKGSQTSEWLDANFGNGVFADTVYVAGNPNIAHLGAEFATIVRLWVDDWDEQLSTARPEIVAERALEAHHAHLDKRLIIHFVQPHEPYLGKTGARFDQFGFTGVGVVTDERIHESMFKSLKRWRVNRSTVWNAYWENLELVLLQVERLADQLDGVTVVAADHGEAFGEWGIYGHPRSVYLDVLVTVPWFVVDGGKRRSIVPTDTTVPAATDDDTLVEDRLTDLRYL